MLNLLFLLSLSCLLLFLQASEIKIKIFTIQRNTGGDLKLWARYHGAIFGYSELHLIDHQSTDSKTLAALEEVRQLGVTIYSMKESFDQKHNFLSELMASFKNTTDFLIPIDIDEFIGFAHADHTTNQVELSSKKERILEEFSNLPRDGRPYKFIFSLSRPLDCDRKISPLHPPLHPPPSLCSSKSFYVHDWWKFNNDDDLMLTKDWKTFYESNSFLVTDQGNHFGSTTRCPHNENELTPHCWHVSNLILFHFHVKSYSHFVSKIFSRYHSYGFTNETDCQTVLAGMHYCLRAKEILSGDENSKSNFYHTATCQVNIPTVVPYNAMFQQYCHF